LSECPCDSTCPPLAGGSRMCHCSCCHETFGGVAGFDLHRRGLVAKRRCASAVEMATLRLVRDDRRVWRTLARFEKAS